jgi:hypothetical protein
MVHFPVNGLDLTKYVEDPEHPAAVYDLFAVSVRKK